MKLSQWIKFLIRRDTTFAGEFSAMRRLAGADCPRFFVDIGANDGFYASNSFPFAVRGWRCLMVEPHPEAFARLRRRHRKAPHVTCHPVACGTQPGTLRLWIGSNRDTTHATFAPEVHASAGKDWASESVEVPVVKLEQLLRESGFPPRFGILSVDTEGWEVEVLRGMNLSIWRPRLIVTEDTARGLAEKRALLVEHGYRQQLTLGVNSFWTSES